jgi:hypothetical protein
MKDTKVHIYILHIFVLAGFALAQPLYDLLRQYPMFLVAHDVRPVQLVLFVALISFGIPLALVAVQFVACALNRAWCMRIQLVLVFMFSTLIILPVVKKVNPGLWLAVFSLVASGLLTYGYYRIRSLRTIVTYLSPAVLVFPALFLFTGSVANLLSPEKGQAVGRATVRATPPIVYIIFDEFSSVSLMDENRDIDADRFPNLAAFAEDAYWCRNATTNSHATHFAVPALLTGTFPPGDRNLMPIFKNYPGNLFTLLQEQYAFNVVEPLTELCPDRHKEQLDGVSFKSFLVDVGLVYAHVVSPGGVSEKLPSVSQNWIGFLDGGDTRDLDPDSPSVLADSVTLDWDTRLKDVMNRQDNLEAFREFVASIPGQPQPSFNFNHCPLPHRPHIYLPSTRKYSPVKFRSAVPAGGEWYEDTLLMGTGYQRYMLQLQCVDTLVGELMEVMKNSGLYDQSLIILTSDHGVNHEMGESRRKLTENNYDEILPIPLFIKLPHQKEGIVDDRNIESVDVVPTIADVLDAEPHWALDGASILDPSTPGRPQKTAYKGKRGITYYDSDFPEKYEALARKLEWVGTGRDPLALYRIGPHGDLVGKSPDELPSADASSKSVRIANANALKKVSLTAAAVPVLISGRVFDRQSRQNNWALAISLNGVIVAVTNSYALDGSDRSERFVCLIPEWALLEGNNVLEVFVIRKDRRGIRRLERLKSI